MRIYKNNNFILCGQVLMFCVIFSVTVSCSTTSTALDRSDVSELDSGYNALLLFLENQQHLTTVKRVKSFFTLQNINEDSSKLIDKISMSSEKAVAELELLILKKPPIVIQDFSDDSIGKATFDSLRITTAKEFIFDPKNFEKNLLLSHAQLLRVISHLAEELEQQESNEKRKAWLIDLAERYEAYFQLVYQRITLV